MTFQNFQKQLSKIGVLNDTGNIICYCNFYLHKIRFTRDVIVYNKLYNIVNVSQKLDLYAHPRI